MFGNHFQFALTQDYCFYENNTTGHQISLCTEAEYTDGRSNLIRENLNSGRSDSKMFHNIIYSCLGFCFLEMRVQVISLIKLMIIDES